MITHEQATEANEFHANGCTRKIGPRGGERVTVDRFRRNGRTQLWVTRPEDFRIPVKFGMYGYGQITHRDALMFHTASDCPLEFTKGEVNV